MNVILLILEILVAFSLLLFAKKIFGKTGVFLWIGIASIIANIQVVKSIDLLGISATLGNVMFASNFLATDILSECYGKKEAKKGVYVGLFSVTTYLIFTQLTIAFIPNEIDTAQGSMKSLFSIAPRACTASIVMYFIANVADVYLFEKIRSKSDKLWVRNNISTIICNCLENFGFVFLAFIGIYEVKDILVIALSTSAIEIFIALCDTPFLYIARKIKEIKEVR